MLVKNNKKYVFVTCYIIIVSVCLRRPDNSIHTIVIHILTVGMGEFAEEGIIKYGCYRNMIMLGKH